jgi:hypothetical protein
MAMFRKDAVFLNVPEGEGAGVAMHHFSEKARSDLFGGDIAELLHVFIECTQSCRLEARGFRPESRIPRRLWKSG